MFHRLDELINKFVVFIVGDARITPAHIQRIVQQLLIVGTDIQHYRQGVGRADAATGGVQRQFADRNAHPADPLVAKTQNTFTVGHDDNFDIVVRDVLQDIVHVMAVLVGDKHAARATINLGETLTGGTHRRGIDNRHHLIKMVLYQSVKQGFVGILNVAQVDMFVDFRFESLILDPGAFGLLFNRLDHFRQ